uniref:Uncharacterized protein n=1 Tax=Anopheles stephensi TaxID=30069 RepID=A0A182YFS8_ANOST
MANRLLSRSYIPFFALTITNPPTNQTVTAVTGGRYIKGDPLNGYYDFVISEGSYKFWVVMQLFTAGLVLYATFAAIYYSKVSPLTSDYDYIDYLNGARSFAGGRTMGGSASGSTLWDTVANSRWFGPAAQTFETVMQAIENAPKRTHYSTANGEGRYIKGDPLNGYYDFIISEGSYKFWAVFQLVTAAVVIYSTLTAIYYSKVAPLTSDYDYIDYLNGGRSFAGARPIDGAARTGASGRRASGWSWDSLSTSSWFGPAAQAFTIVMDAIERQPK